VKYDDIHPTLRQALGCHEGFRKMGFPPDNLFVEISPTKDPAQCVIFMTLKWRKHEPFRLIVGLWPTGQERELTDQWRSACEAFNSGALSREDGDRIWQESFIYLDKMGFAAALLARNIRPPRGLS
jgi:hypothetical protein